MGNTNLKCNSCGHEFTGNEYTFSCPSCGGDSLVILKSETFLEKLKNLFYTNRIVAGISVFALLVLGFLLWPSGPEALNVEQSIDVLTFKKEKNHIEIIITRYSQDLKNKEVLDFGKNKLFFSECRFEAFGEGSEAVTIKDGKIYPCSNGLITIKWDKKNFFVNSKRKYPQPSKIIEDFTLPDQGPSKNAGCREKLELTVRKGKDCNITILSNFDTLYPKLKVMISVKGKNGNYKDKRDWKFNKTDKNYDVWGFVSNSDTISPIIDAKGSATGCNPLNRNEIENAAKALGNDPVNFKLCMRLRDLLDGKGTIYINGKKFEDINNVTMSLEMEYYKNNRPFVTKCSYRNGGEMVNVYFNN